MKALSYWIALSLALSFSLPGITQAGEEYLEDDNNAKLARIKAKQRVWEAMDGGDEGSGSGAGGGECGSLNIGNVQNNGVGGRPREVIVVVTGDVINANNNCRR